MLTSTKIPKWKSVIWPYKNAHNASHHLNVIYTMHCNENETQIYDAKLKSKIFQPTNFHITRWLIQSRIRKQPVLFISIYYVLRQPVTKKKSNSWLHIYTLHTWDPRDTRSLPTQTLSIYRNIQPGIILNFTFSVCLCVRVDVDVWIDMESSCFTLCRSNKQQEIQ